MLRYTDYDIVFREIPDETTLAVNLAGCPNRCPGCNFVSLSSLSNVYTVVCLFLSHTVVTLSTLPFAS